MSKPRKIFSSKLIPPPFSPPFFPQLMCPNYYRRAFVQGSPAHSHEGERKNVTWTLRGDTQTEGAVNQKPAGQSVRQRTHLHSL